jgi:hypothetical protein
MTIKPDCHVQARYKRLATPYGTFYRPVLLVLRDGNVKPVYRYTYPINYLTIDDAMDIAERLQRDAIESGSVPSFS